MISAQFLHMKARFGQVSNVIDKPSAADKLRSRRARFSPSLFPLQGNAKDYDANRHH